MNTFGLSNLLLEVFVLLGNHSQVRAHLLANIAHCAELGMDAFNVLVLHVRELNELSDLLVQVLVGKKKEKIIRRKKNWETK